MKKFIVLLLSILFTMSIMGCSAVSIDGSSPASSDSANSQNMDGDKNGILQNRPAILKIWFPKELKS